MLGKRNHRAAAFSTCHAIILSVFIVLAHLMTVGTAERSVQVSEADAAPNASTSQCVSLKTEPHVEVGCAALLPTRAPQGEAVRVVIWQHGVWL
ncbi:hypothetical protein [Marivita sp. XM-24bin2]|jgi:hypothetical protein|uniref:hypothetical protein n=1 Tax=unclassified Marivita TaxID=2632480 RepID=UPI000D79DD6B|nr:hypothetical protein [Marivita sp. XM-24bin2]MCR9108098.1 hypothetical protein [Paracoccaceae bacterium]PWL36031.1 MAG: hypothetical protein DCO97_06180 [Marivita sp. XM-24bin2]